MVYSSNGANDVCIKHVKHSKIGKAVEIAVHIFALNCAEAFLEHNFAVI